GPVRREDVRSTESRGERRQCKAAAELDDLEVCDGALRDRARQRVAARPSLGPVGQELLALERLLVEQGLGVARPEDRQRASWQLDAVLDEVELFHLRSACNEAATPWTPPCRIVKERERSSTCTLYTCRPTTPGTTRSSRSAVTPTEV